MRAEVGDELTVKGRRQGDEERHGEIVKIDGADGAPPYVVRWRDGRETIFFPASGTEVTHHPAPRVGQERAMITRAEIGKLGALHVVEPVMLSLYLAVPPPADLPARAGELIAAAEAACGQPMAGQNRTWVLEQLPPCARDGPGRTVADFACADTGLLEAIPLPCPLTERDTGRPAPYPAAAAGPAVPAAGHEHRCRQPKMSSCQGPRP